MIIETERLKFYEFSSEDAEDMYFLNNDPEVIKYTGDPPFSSVDAANEFIEKYDHYKKNGFGRWTVRLKENHQYLGWCGLKMNEHQQVDIGFRYYRNQWNKGYATESAIATIEYGFTSLNLQEIIGRAAKENTASLRVLEKLGMKFWKEDSCKGIAGAVYYIMTKDDYLNHHNKA